MRPALGGVGVRRGAIVRPRMGNNSGASRADVTGNGSGCIGQLLSKRRMRQRLSRARASAMWIFRKILRERPAGVRVAMSCSSRSPMSRRSVSVVPRVVELYDVSWSARRAGGVGVDCSWPATIVGPRAAEGMSLHLVSRQHDGYVAPTWSGERSGCVRAALGSPLRLGS